MKLTPGDVVLDFYTAFPPVAVLRANQVRSVAGYLKNYRPAYVADVHAAGIGFTPIFEAGETSALAGAPLGTSHGRLAVAQAKKGGIPAGVVIIFTHDSSAWSPAIPAYFQAAEREARAAGYGFGGYMSKQVADACRAIGVVLDISWAPAAYAWGGGRDPQAHVWQKPSSVLPGGGPVDMGVVKRTVDVWVAGEHTDPKPDKPETVTPPSAVVPHLSPVPNPLPQENLMDCIITLPDGTILTGMGAIQKVNGADKLLVPVARWTGPGDTPERLERITTWLNRKRDFGAHDITANRADIATVTLDGPVPPGYLAQDFAPNTIGA